MDSKKVMGFLSGAMEANIKENSKIIILKDLATIYGLTEENMRDTGEITKCMGEVFLCGLMGDAMMGNM